MTAVLPDRPDVIDASDDDQRAAVMGALERSGFTFDELAEQARTGDYATVRARLAWVAIGGLRDFTP